MKKGMGSERGQILVMLAAGLMLLMLAATALAVDWGNGLLQKRRLQNVADAAAAAAAHELGQGGTTTSAVSVAQGIVSSNTDGVVPLPYPGDGAGSSLSSGIELTGREDIRVALVRQVSTYFAPVLGVNSLTVRVRSRASVGPFGVLPITVKRFSEGDTSVPLGQGGNPSQVRDYLAPGRDAFGQINYISSWPSPLTTPAYPPAGYTPPDAYDERVSGPVMPLVGRRALPNVANGSDFHFFVAPDVRGITQAVPQYYNGADLSSASSAQLLKNTTLGYILNKGYPGPNPTLEEQLGGFSGTPTDQAVDAMKKVYRRGDVVAAMVFDGTVYRKPSFDLRLDSSIKSSADIGPSGSPLTFQVTLRPVNNFTSYVGVEFSATGLEGWGDWQFESAGLNTVYSQPVTGADVTVSFSVSSGSTVQGARTALIRAYDPASGTMRTAAATVVVAGAPSFSLSCAEAFKTVEESSATRFDMELRGWNGYPTTNVIVESAVEWFTSGHNPSPTSAPAGVTWTLPSTVQVRDGHSVGLRMNIDIAAGASLGEWMMKLRVRDPNDSSRDQSIYLTLQIIPASTNPTVSLSTSFVKVLGYAAFVITYSNNSATPSPSLDGNTVYAYAVTPLMQDASSLGLGTRSRLLGWNQTR